MEVVMRRSKELTADARELKGELYCLPCHDKMGVPICGACRRPIEGRVVNAMGKQWHVEVGASVCQRVSLVFNMYLTVAFISYVVLIYIWVMSRKNIILLIFVLYG